MNRMKIVLAVLVVAMLLGARRAVAVKGDAAPNDMPETESKTLMQYQKITPEEARQMIAGEEVTIVDVRTAAEYAQGHIENAILVPNESIGDQAAAELPDTDATLLVYCRSGRRSKEGCETLLSLGYQNVYDLGGIIDWPYAVVID